MLSDEEKEILNNIKEYMQNDIDKGYHKFVYNDLGSDFKCIDCINAIDNVLNLIEKQSKEIEELKKPKYVINCKTNEITKLTNDFVSKDKIKEILEIEENIDNEKLLSLLQTIVDENARLEDIEDRKLQIEYNNVFNKGVKSVEDKIKAKIEEVKDGTYDAKIVLQSLLEKE